MSKKRDLMPYSYLEKCLFLSFTPLCREAECCSGAALCGGSNLGLGRRGEDGTER